VTRVGAVTGPVLDGPEPVWVVGVRVLDGYVRAYCQLSITGLDHIPRSGPALLVANHVSYLDPIVLLVVGHRAGRRTRFLAVQEAFTRPGSGYFLRVGRHIPTGEGTAERTLALRRARDALNRGEVVVIYPEGTITRNGERRAAQGGVGLLALISRAPVIPIRTWGLERGTAPWWHRRRVQVAIGPPVDLAPALAATGRRRYDLTSALALAAVRALPRPS
jgi:1-acyl-sn-glycerol-3-phosphate acyltransferase